MVCRHLQLITVKANISIKKIYNNNNDNLFQYTTDD